MRTHRASTLRLLTLVSRGVAIMFAVDLLRPESGRLESVGASIATAISIASAIAAERFDQRELTKPSFVAGRDVSESLREILLCGQCNKQLIDVAAAMTCPNGIHDLVMRGDLYVGELQSVKGSQS
jgi:hypothetical protein